MKQLGRKLSVVLLAFSATGCGASVYQDSSSPPLADYGNSVRQNMSVMVVDPQPATAANTQLDFDGRKAGIAIERYRQGKVIPPVELRTTDILAQ